ncbi:hypothetical protein QCD70_09895 [Agreia sp. PsM10]|uniref:hypothetical protein n=1 Tax=Agreia sp. PsM10 TaxID=3030533 RepID=UPI00263AEEE3|nr:hypothetical protein [Agreia sp. PsM10]MDN4640553.1 hypothetical protein [Agreia sp. PsM10]
MIGILVFGAVFAALIIALVVVSTNQKRDSPKTPGPEAVVASLAGAWDERNCADLRSATTEKFRNDRGWRQCTEFEQALTLPETVTTYPAETFDSLAIDGKYADVHACETTVLLPTDVPTSENTTTCLWYHLEFNTFGWKIYATSGLVD